MSLALQFSDSFLCYLWLDLNSATHKDFLAPRPIQAHYLPAPAQDRTQICTFIPCQGSQWTDTRVGMPGRIQAPPPLVSKGNCQGRKTSVQTVGQMCSTVLRHVAKTPSQYSLKHQRKGEEADFCQTTY